MKIISINAGSSSLKFRVFDMKDENVMAKGQFERIGIEGSFYTIKFGEEVVRHEVEVNSHEEAVEIMVEKLLSIGIIKNLAEINGVGHRVLHGGEYFSDSVVINDDVIEKIDELTKFGPLHHPGELAGIKAMQKFFPNAMHVAVFDTSFHQTIEEENYLFPVPYDWYSKYGIRKYGFHGTSHRYISEAVKDILGTDQYRLISCHIGNGISMAAIKDGKCIDTTMGFTPLGGVMMGTRSGDIDPSIIPYVMECEGKNASEIIDDLNRCSGVVGISGYSSDMRDLVAKCEEGDEKAILARNKYVRRIVDAISSYYVLLGGVDIISLTAGVGENNKEIREEIIKKLKPLGIELDKQANEKRGEFCKITTNKSKVDVYVIPTDEELLIARDTLMMLNR